MDSIFKRLRSLAEDELLAISQAIDDELSRRLSRDEDLPDSAKRRAVMRSQSYRRNTGSSAAPVFSTGIGKDPRRRAA